MLKSIETLGSNFSLQKSVLYIGRTNYENPGEKLKTNYFYIN